MSTEQGLDTAANVNKHIDAFRDRVAFLEDRIARTDRVHDGWDRREVAAINWAIPVLEAERDHLIRLRQAIQDAGGMDAPEMRGAPTCVGCGATMVQGDDDWYCPAMEAEMDKVIEDHLARVAARRQ